MLLLLLVFVHLAVHVVGRYEGRTFEDRDVSFVVGEGLEVGIIDGIDQAIKKFKKGERSVLKVKSKYAYGALGCKEHNIPANADLEYEVELKKFEKVSTVVGVVVIMVVVLLVRVVVAIRPQPLMA